MLFDELLFLLNICWNFNKVLFLGFGHYESGLMTGIDVILVN